jgi:branched-chain amino acid transport system substrate-binding protein
MKIDDFFAKGGTIRADGILMHDMYMLKVKADGKGEWDLAETVSTIPAKRAYLSPENSECPALKR